MARMPASAAAWLQRRHGRGIATQDGKKLTEGRGRSGSRFGLCFEPPSDDGGHGRWRINVDDAVLCAVDSAESAVWRAEGLEAVRCIIRGLSADLTDEQLHHAQAIAREMMEAADQALATAPSANRAQLLHSARSLRFVTDVIRKQCSRRKREDGPPASLLAH
jgi:hypothetical protein